MKADNNNNNHGLGVVKESRVYSRYLQVFDRAVLHPNSTVVKYDVVSSSNDRFVVIFPYERATDTVTLIREYCQGPNAMCWGLPSGGFCPTKHRSMLEAAQFELSEEAHLHGGTWVHLGLSQSPAQGALIHEGKWILNAFAPFLCIDAEPDEHPRPRDAEELIEIVTHVSLERTLAIILSGEMLPPSVQTCLMAFHFLGRLFLGPPGRTLPHPLPICMSPCCSPIPERPPRSPAASPLSSPTFASPLPPLGQISLLHQSNATTGPVVAATVAGLFANPSNGSVLDVAVSSTAAAAHPALAEETEAVTPAAVCCGPRGLVPAISSAAPPAQPPSV